MKRFGTFEGVFVPSLLSIFGVIMYLRLGWVVGQVGLGASLVIIVLSNLISIATGLSISSIVTNIRIGHGGAYSIISKSLGIETGGAMGIPLYISQAISVAFYVIGFAEIWTYIFPRHLFLGVCLFAWLSILLVSYYSAKLSFRIQYFVLVMIGLSFASMFLGNRMISPDANQIMVQAPGNFLKAFAIFFPAVTGFMAGLTMSGELNNPKRSIPVGTLSAIAVSFVSYLIIAIWFFQNAPASSLVSNTAIAIELGRWPWLVVVGVMGATLSSALNMCVIAPRTLFALAKNPALPFLKHFLNLNSRQEPSTAVLLTALIALLTITLGNLNQVAVLLTMFFLITYGLINFSVFFEQIIRIPSFRPSFRVPTFVSFFGALGCIVVMLLINFVFSLIAILIIFLLYSRLIRHESKFYSPDVRSGILIFLSEQAAKISSRLPYYPKIWKPNVVVPVLNLEDFFKSMSMLQSFVYPSGRLTVFYVATKEEKNLSEERLEKATNLLDQEGIFTKGFVVESVDKEEAVKVVMQSLKGAYFPPNTCFMVLSSDPSYEEKTVQLIQQASNEKLGTVVFIPYEQIGLPSNGTINLWIRRGSPNVNLSVLIAIQLQKNWQGRIRLIQIIDLPEERDEAIAFLCRLGELMRFPSEVDVEVLVGKFPESLHQAQTADINILGMLEVSNLDFFRKIACCLKTPVLILKDSLYENAMA